MITRIFVNVFMSMEESPDLLKTRTEIFTQDEVGFALQPWGRGWRRRKLGNENLGI